MTHPETTGSTVPRRQLGRHLRELRGGARLTVRAAARALEWSEAKMWRIETGQTAMRSLDVQAMCQVYGADATTTEALMGLAKETKARGWWHSYGDAIPEYFDVYIGLEEAAIGLRWYESELVPGLLQTEEYARTVITTDNPGMAETEIDRRVHVRVSRQTLLTRVTAPPNVDVVLNEAVLHRPVGGQAAHRRQLQRLIDVTDLPSVSVRIIPFAAGLHHGILSGPFVLLDFPLTGDGQPTEPDTVYVDGFTGALYLDRAAEAHRHATAFAALASTALDVAGTRDLIRDTMKEHGP